MTMRWPIKILFLSIWGGIALLLSAEYPTFTFSIAWIGGVVWCMVDDLIDDFYKERERWRNSVTNSNKG